MLNNALVKNGSFQASFEETDLRIGEIKKTMYEFERDICKGSVNPRTNKIIAERVIRHFEDKLKSRVRNGFVFAVWK